ncbi:TetR/AcrR family transcriptional regulator [Gorillibacterium massiliense]|uniref:TetR/AcrR family transcriptional regulator n=1 Tax=Gorillibacterium massiliense TaxID=1280390 RepID=UPI0004B387C3|nr:TetR/AcrR family transcriptional regulator [Gorillibacterium massiliense]
MPPKRELTKERILDGAFDFVRVNGFDALTARSITQFLQCSTQPVYSVFGSIDGLKKAVYERTAEFAGSRMKEYQNRDNASALNLAIGFLLFAKDEKQLFRTLYLSGYKTYDPKSELLLGEELTTSHMRFSKRLHSATAPLIKSLFLKLSIYLIGIGTMMNSGTLELGIDEAKEMVTEMYEMLLTKEGLNNTGSRTGGQGSEG